MYDQGPGRPRSQFSLRKLLLWTAVVAILLGIAMTRGMEELSVFLCWTILVCAIRCGFGPKVAVIVSVATWTILGGLLGYFGDVIVHPGPDLVMLAAGWLIVGGFFGLVMFGLAEGLVRVVDWADNLMRTKSDGETGRD